MELPPKPLEGETADDYIMRVAFELDKDARWWCLRCGCLVRDRYWCLKHYRTSHGFSGF